MSIVDVENVEVPQEMLSAIADAAGVVDRERLFPRASLAALGEAGLLGLSTPAEHGGVGGGLSALAQMCEAGASVPLFPHLHEVDSTTCSRFATTTPRSIHAARQRLVPAVDRVSEYVGMAPCWLDAHRGP